MTINERGDGQLINSIISRRPLTLAATKSGAFSIEPDICAYTPVRPISRDIQALNSKEKE